MDIIKVWRERMAEKHANPHGYNLNEMSESFRDRFYISKEDFKAGFDAGLKIGELKHKESELLLFLKNELV